MEPHEVNTSHKLAVTENRRKSVDCYYFSALEVEEPLFAFLMRNGPWKAQTKGESGGTRDTIW